MIIYDKPQSNEHAVDQHRQLMVPWKLASFGARSTHFFIKLNTVIIPYRIRLDRERDRLFSRWQNGFHFQQGKATIG